MSLIIIVITLSASVLAFSNRQLFEMLSLKPIWVVQKFQVYRVLSHALIHADWTHLLVNMLVLFSFGNICEQYFAYYFGNSSQFIFLVFYLLSLVISSIYSIVKHKSDRHYSAIGASGAVMAVVFSSIFFDPWNKINFFGLLPIPGILFGGLYLGYSYYMGKKGMDNVGHDAHFTGAIFGFVFPLIINPELASGFIERLLMR